MGGGESARGGGGNGSERKIEDWRVVGGKERGEEAPESLLPVTSLALVPRCAALRSRLSRNHLPTVETRGALRCGDFSFFFTAGLFFSSRLPVLSQISVNCFTHSARRRKDKERGRIGEGGERIKSRREGGEERKDVALLLNHEDAENSRSAGPGGSGLERFSHQRYGR